MNFPRFTLAASVAAALHVALLWFLPVEPYTRTQPLIEVPLPPWPETPATVATAATSPADEPADTIPIKSLSSQPVRPELPGEIITRESDVSAIPVENRVSQPTDKINIVPGKLGSGDGPFRPDGPDGPTICRAGDLDSVPNASVQVAPEYPFALWQEGTSGSVLVEFTVDRTGQVTTARIVRSSRREFEEPTLRAVLKWRFEPGRRDGRAVPFRLIVPVDFAVEN